MGTWMDRRVENGRKRGGERVRDADPCSNALRDLGGENVARKFRCSRRGSNDAGAHGRARHSSGCSNVTAYETKNHDARRDESPPQS